MRPLIRAHVIGPHRASADGHSRTLCTPCQSLIETRTKIYSRLQRSAVVQVQSTWFPVIDRNPQKFVPSIYDAKATDFVKATQRVYAAPGMASQIALPVLPE
jgi:hypothetical protein